MDEDTGQEKKRPHLNPDPEPDLDEVAEGLESVHQRLDSNREQLAANRAEWRELVVKMCRLYHEGRTLNRSNAAFSRWLTKHHLDHRLSVNDRSAAIAMGGDLELTRAVLAKTNSRSIRLIYEGEWRRLCRAAKTSKSASGSTAGANAGSTSTAGAGPTSGAGSSGSGAGSSRSKRRRTHRSSRTAFGLGNGVMPLEHFKLIRKCLHPDRILDPDLKLEYTKAFQIFTGYKNVLCPSDKSKTCYDEDEDDDD